MSKKIITISGKVVYQELGMGFWGIIDDSGKEWLPINLPKRYEVKDKRVHLKAKLVEGGMSVFMWGTMIELV